MKIQDAIHRAIQNGAMLSDISKFISERPILTSAEGGRSIAMSTDYGPDPENEKYFIKFWTY
jgi:hypothetical protein